MGLWNGASGSNVVVEVEQQDIDRSLERNSSHCAVAMAIQRTFPLARHVCVDLQSIRFTLRRLRYVFLTPHVAQDIIVAFDQGEREKIVPFVMRMRPAQIARAGKRRRQCPDAEELRGSGLTVAKHQLHIDDPPPRYLSNGKRNTDPDRSDGLAPVIKPRQGLALPPLTCSPKLMRAPPRRKISAASKGSIPTTLGGRLPPVSILSRREFGLRQIRR